MKLKHLAYRTTTRKQTLRGLSVFMLFTVLTGKHENRLSGRLTVKRMHDRNEPPHDKTNKMDVRPAKTQISLGIRPV